MKLPFSYLRVPQEVQHEIATKALEEFDNPSYEQNSYYAIRRWDSNIFPITKGFLRSLGFEIMFYRVFMSPPSFNDRITIHKDTDGQKAALNIPIQTHSIIHWYEHYPETGLLVKGRVSAVLPYSERIEITEDQFHSKYIDAMREYTRTWVPTCTTAMDKPLVVKTDIWHRSVNVGNERRSLVSFRLKNNPEMDAVIDAFKQAGFA